MLYSLYILCIQDVEKEGRKFRSIENLPKQTKRVSKNYFYLSRAIVSVIIDNPNSYFVQNYTFLTFYEKLS